jgi:hypothetical protein
MIPTIQIVGEPDLHPERPIHDAHELSTGQIDINKLKAKNHCTRVFDLMSKDERQEYESLYVELLNKSREGKILVSSNTREVLQRPDGSTGWFKFLEWTEFDTSEILGA